ncbi:hypothetical protein AGMMS50229_16320 [Campylobacterota bacterium]|nr:hypothetical protein AGMMS50229_16320 [Campylobacterota bacterium]
MPPHPENKETTVIIFNLLFSFVAFLNLHILSKQAVFAGVRFRAYGEQLRTLSLAEEFGIRSLYTAFSLLVVVSLP